MDGGIERRLAVLEKEVAALKSAVGKSKRGDPNPKVDNAWLDTLGGFKDDPIYDEAMRSGRAWRKRKPKC